MLALVMSARYSLCQCCSEQKCTPREAELLSNECQSRSDMLLLTQVFCKKLKSFIDG